MAQELTSQKTINFSRNCIGFPIISIGFPIFFQLKAQVLPFDKFSNFFLVFLYIRYMFERFLIIPSPYFGICEGFVYVMNAF
jgi:hypothetical protein